MKNRAQGFAFNAKELMANMNMKRLKLKGNKVNIERWETFIVELRTYVEEHNVVRYRAYNAYLGNGDAPQCRI